MNDMNDTCVGNGHMASDSSIDRLTLFKQRLKLFEEQRQSSQVNQNKLKVTFSDIKANMNSDCPVFRAAVERKLKQRQLRRTRIRKRKAQTKQWKQSVLENRQKLHEQIDERLRLEHQRMREAKERADTIERVKKMLHEVRAKNDRSYFAEEEQALEEILRHDDIVYEQWYRALFGTSNTINKENPILVAEHNFEELIRIR